MCSATPITVNVNTFLIDVSYSRATFSLEMLGSEQAIEDRGLTSSPGEFAGLRVH